MQSMQKRVAEAESATQIAGIAQALFGLTELPRGSVFQVTAVEERARQLAVLAIHPGAPRSIVDGFVLNWCRSLAAGILVSGKLLRDEPNLRYELTGPAQLSGALHDYRREVVGLHEAPMLLILTSAKDIDPAHPAFHSWARPVIFTDDAGASRCRSLFDSSRVRVVVTPKPSPPAALTFLLEETRGGNISIEAGPAVSRALRDVPGAVSELYLSCYQGDPLPGDAHAGVLMDAQELEARWTRENQACVVVEESGPWSFSRFLRRSEPST